MTWTTMKFGQFMGFSQKKQLISIELSSIGVNDTGNCFMILSPCTRRDLYKIFFIASKVNQDV